MIARERRFTFGSVFDPYIREYIENRKSLGFKFVVESGVLRQFDRYCQSVGCSTVSITRELVEGWISTKPDDRPSTRSHRICTLKGFCGYLSAVNQIVSWHPGPGYCSVSSRSRYTPYIFTHEEMQRIFEKADCLPKPRGSMFHVVFPTVLRMLYSCGLRVSEALKLCIKDVDMEHGFIFVHDTKFEKSRRLPISASLQIVLEKYKKANSIGFGEDDFFFPNAKGEMYSQRTVYDKFRAILWQSGIPHQGLGKGPRVHDLRHTFAVHSLQKCTQEGMDVHVLLPVLAAYLGHGKITATEHYLRLTAEVYPDFLQKAGTLTGKAIPEVTTYEP